MVGAACAIGAELVAGAGTYGAGVVVGTTGGATAWATGFVGVETLILVVVVEDNALVFKSDVGA